jgi:hypothetical protein
MNGISNDTVFHLVYMAHLGRNGIQWCYNSGRHYREGFATKEVAMEKLDKILVSKGFRLLTEEQYGRLRLLV